MRDKQMLSINSILHGNKYQYCIEKVLGQGSFGITYLAKIKLTGSLGNLQTDVTVAVKEFFMRDINWRSGTNVLAGSNSDLYGHYLNDFIREANNLSKLKHPNIVKVLEFFEENNTAYFSMEYVDGGNLNDYIQSNGSLSEKESLENIVQIISALSCMHKNMMLHMDLKPINIMRRKNGDLVLIDFGLSKRFNSDGEPESSTYIGRGTIGYAPLEQLSYKKEDSFSPTLDIYALGGTLYKMLTGITPPDASTIFNDGFPEEQMKDKGISQDLISLVLWAMEPMKKKRPQTTEEFLKEVKRLLPYASDTKKSMASNSYQSSEEPTVEILEICNGFHIYWDYGVTEMQKNGIRKLLKAMRKIGERKQFINTEYGPEQISNNVIMSLGEFTWHYLCSIFEEDKTVGMFQNQTISFVLKAIQQLALWTGLSFRLANEDEIGNLVKESKAKDYKILCYSKSKRLQYKTYGSGGCLNDIVTFEDLNISVYDIQLVCDGVKPIYHKNGFCVPCTQEFVDDVIPLGFNLYKVRKGNLWNIKSPESPIASYLDMDHETVSNIGVWHIPGPGPMSGMDYIGVKAVSQGINYYYSFKDGQFNLLEKLSDKDIKEREKWS